MPIAASDLERELFLRVLLMGFAKCGKTTSTIESLVRALGAGYVIECGDKSALAPAMRRTKKFHFDLVRDEESMEAAIKEAKRGAKEGRYKWIVMDDYSLYASWLEGALRDASAASNKSGEPDGRKYWMAFKDRILNTIRRLLDAPAHVVFISHYISPGQEIDGQRAKSGMGIMPMISGAAREEVPALFQDVIFMEKQKEQRVFKINPEGVWGPGCRSVDGTKDIPADFGIFLKEMQTEGLAPVKKAAGSR